MSTWRDILGVKSDSLSYPHNPHNPQNYPYDPNSGDIGDIGDGNSDAERQIAVPLSTADRLRIEAWLDHIDEHDKAIRAEVLDMCQRSGKARAYYLARAAEIAPQTEAPARWGELRPCSWCAELNRLTGVCEAARRGLHATKGYKPHQDIPRRCEHYEPRLRVVGTDKTKGDQT